jgi:hypothetical protein
VWSEIDQIKNLEVPNLERDVILQQAKFAENMKELAQWQEDFH